MQCCAVWPQMPKKAHIFHRLLLATRKARALRLFLKNQVSLLRLATSRSCRRSPIIPQVSSLPLTGYHAMQRSLFSTAELALCQPPQCHRVAMGVVGCRGVSGTTITVRAAWSLASRWSRTSPTGVAWFGVHGGPRFFVVRGSL